MALEKGTQAPDFELRNQHGELVRLSDFRGKKAVTLVFYPLAFSSRCEGELCELRDNVALFEDADVELIGISVDSMHTLRAWSDEQNYRFSLLADFWPHGEVAQKYGVFLPDKGFANRGTFLIDRDGILQWSMITEPGESRPLDAYRVALDELAPANA